jgi:membrane-associated protein
MDFLKDILDVVLHLDKHLDVVIKNCGAWSYLLFFAIIFSETGFVVTPFLPGDSLLFVLGAFSALGSLSFPLLLAVLFGAAVLGNTVNYMIGKFFGERLMAKGDSRFFKKEYIDKTHLFFEKYGGKTIVITRFVPVVRTFAPFVAGLGKMSYVKFTMYNVAGGLLWVGVLVPAGYFFGNMPLIRNNFTAAILVIVIISILPIVIEYLKHQKSKTK